MISKYQRTSKFDREFRQAEYELEKVLEDAIINIKHKGLMTRTSFYNMQVHKAKQILKLNLPNSSAESANRFLMKCMRIWDTEDLR